jgi:hypothetical protein
MIGVASVLGSLSRLAVCVLCVGFFPCFGDDGSDPGCFGVVPVPASGCVLSVCVLERLAV